MAKFVFEFKDVLEYRRFEQEQAEGELARALGVEAEIQGKLELVASQYAASNAKLKGSLDFEDIVAGTRYRKLLDFQREELLKQLAEAKLVTEQKRKILAETMKKTSVLEKLRDKQEEEFNAQAEQAEAEELDDLFLPRQNARTAPLSGRGSST